jgi:hypothetical protein
VGSPLALIACLAAGASVQGDVSARAETLSTTIAPRGRPSDTRVSLSVAPRARVELEALPMRLSTAYAPRFWTNDAEERRSLLVNHVLEGRLDTRHDAPWRAELAAVGTRGWVDPVADVLTAGSAAGPGGAAPPPGGGQVPSSEPFEYEALHAGALADVPFGPRTTVVGTARWEISRAVAPADRAIFPVQRNVTMTAVLTRLLAERDELLLTATATQSWTEAIAGTTRSGTSTALATWRRRTSPTVQAWAGAGATFAHFGTLVDPGAIEVLAAANAGVVRAGTELASILRLSGELTTLVDRYTGEVNPTVTVTGALGWRATERVTVETELSGASRTDGVTSLARATARVVWMTRQRAEIAAGIGGRAQHEERPQLPSFLEGIAFVSVAYVPERLFRSGEEREAGEREAGR